MSLIEVSHLSKFFDSESGRVVALNDVSFNVDEGEFVGIVGKSGSGKTTLINMLTGIDHPSEGSIVINGNHLEKMSENELSIWRGKNIGIVFQFFQLLPVMTVMENILLPMDYLNELPMNARTWIVRIRSRLSWKAISRLINIRMNYQADYSKLQRLPSRAGK